VLWQPGMRPIPSIQPLAFGLLVPSTMVIPQEAARAADNPAAAQDLAFKRLAMNSCTQFLALSMTRVPLLVHSTTSLSLTGKVLASAGELSKSKPGNLMPCHSPLVSIFLSLPSCRAFSSSATVYTRRHPLSKRETIVLLALITSITRQTVLSESVL